MASEPCKRVVLVLCVKNDTAPSPIRLQIAEDTLPQEGVDHESMCYGVQRESLILNS